MLKRTIATYLIFFGLALGSTCILDLMNVIQPMSFVAHLVNAFSISGWYLVFIFIYTRKYAELALLIFCILGIAFIIVTSKILGTPTKEVISINPEFIITCFLIWPQTIIANIQGNKYKKEKLLKKLESSSNKVEFEEVSPNGKKRKGIIRT